MNLLNIVPVMSCNKTCSYCPVRKWLKPLDFEYEHPPYTPDTIPHTRFNRFTNEPFLKYIDIYLNPKEWIIEITGGEPGLYKEIDTLIPALSDRGYFTLVKTNGEHPIPKADNCVRIASWHKGEPFPNHYDQIIILKNPDDNWRDKVEYCKQNNIPYKTSIFEPVTGENDFHTDKRYLKENKIKKMLHINNLGEVTPCPKTLPPEFSENTIFNLSKPEFKDLSQCPRCKLVNDVEVFLPDYIKEKL